MAGGWGDDVLTSRRLRLRRWTAGDLDAFAAINQDPAVMATLGPPLSRENSSAFIERIEACFDERGWGLWCVEVVDGPPCIGYVGLWPVPDDLPAAPAVEIGWRLASARWGRGYAPEAAAVVLDDAFSRLGLDDIVSFTAVINDKSRRVMEKLGLVRDPADDFDHPRLAIDDPLRPHVLYRVSRADWIGRRGA